jgi:hypothetical protein
MLLEEIAELELAGVSQEEIRQIIAGMIADLMED